MRTQRFFKTQIDVAVPELQSVDNQRGDNFVLERIQKVQNPKIFKLFLYIYIKNISHFLFELSVRHIF